MVRENRINLTAWIMRLTVPALRIGGALFSLGPLFYQGGLLRRLRGRSEIARNVSTKAGDFFEDVFMGCQCMPLQVATHNRPGTTQPRPAMDEYRLPITNRTINQIKGPPDRGKGGNTCILEPNPDQRDLGALLIGHRSQESSIKRKFLLQREVQEGPHPRIQKTAEPFPARFLSGIGRMFACQKKLRNDPIGIVEGDVGFEICHRVNLRLKPLRLEVIQKGVRGDRFLAVTLERCGS